MAKSSKRSRSESIKDCGPDQPVEKRRRSNRLTSAPASHNDPVTSATDSPDQTGGKRRSSNRLASASASQSDPFASASGNQITESNRRDRKSTASAGYAESDPDEDKMWDVESCISIRPIKESAWKTGILPHVSQCEALLVWEVGGLSWEPMSDNPHNSRIAQYVHSLTRKQKPKGYRSPKGFRPHALSPDDSISAVYEARRKAETMYPEFFAAEEARLCPSSSSPSDGDSPLRRKSNAGSTYANSLGNLGWITPSFSPRRNRQDGCR